VGINAVTLEAMDVTHHELVMNGVSVQMKLAKDLLVQGDRVQPLQVIVSLGDDCLSHRNSEFANSS
jgi:hypothetical protein